MTLGSFSLSGIQVLLAIVSTYLLALIQAGASVFHQIESWSLPRSLLCHVSLLYVTYVACYLMNSWISFRPGVILIFTGIFAAIYANNWLTIYLSIRFTSRRLNARIE